MSVTVFNMKVVTVFLVTVVMSALSEESLRCPDKFIERLTRCYSFSNITCDWYNSWKECERLQSKLISIETYKEQEIITNYIKQISGGIKLNWWTSGSNQVEDEEWHWMTTTYKLGYENFCGTQIDPEGNCLALAGDCNYSWRQLDCAQTAFRFVCERDVLL